MVISLQADEIMLETVSFLAHVPYLKVKLVLKILELSCSQEFRQALL